MPQKKSGAGSPSSRERNCHADPETPPGAEVSRILREIHAKTASEAVELAEIVIGMVNATADAGSNCNRTFHAACSRKCRQGSRGGNSMKFAILSDVHANLEALQAVLADSMEQSCAH